MNPVPDRANVDYHIASLEADARAERLAAMQRRLHVEEHAVHPSLDHRHVPGALRRTLGHAIIVLGAAIAGSADAGARRAA